MSKKLKSRKKSVTAYYHITEKLQDWLKIGHEGLKASNDGYIYLLTNKDVADYVAQNQLLIKDNYGLIKISPKGITGVLEDDNVGELTAKYQKRVKQDFIEAKFVKLSGMFQLID